MTDRNKRTLFDHTLQYLDIETLISLYNKTGYFRIVRYIVLKKSQINHHFRKTGYNNDWFRWNGKFWSGVFLNYVFLSKFDYAQLENKYNRMFFNGSCEYLLNRWNNGYLSNKWNNEYQWTNKYSVKCFKVEYNNWHLMKNYVIKKKGVYIDYSLYKPDRLDVCVKYLLGYNLYYYMKIQNEKKMMIKQKKKIDNYVYRRQNIDNKNQDIKRFNQNIKRLNQKIRKNMR